MTREEAKKLLPIIEAFANGEEIEIDVCQTGSWGLIVANPSFTSSPDAYRIKPKPVLVPLDYSDNIVGRILESENEGYRCIVTEQNEKTVYVGGANVSYKYGSLLKLYKLVNADGSKSPCGKYVDVISKQRNEK